MFRVLTNAIAQFDLRLLLFAALIATAAVFNAFQIVSHARDWQGRGRMLRLLFAGTGPAAAMWAVHFLAIRAYAWDLPTAYDPTLVALALLLAIVTTTTGFALAAPEGRLPAVAGGALIGLGIALTHVVGMRALEVPAVLHRSLPVAILLNVLAAALCCAAMIAHRELGRRWALWIASALLALAICGLHFAAVGTIVATSDMATELSQSYISGTTLAIVAACITALIMAAGQIANLRMVLSSRDAERDLRGRHAVLQAREEELRQQNVRFDMALRSLPHGLIMVDAERRLLVCNKRFADMYGIPPELTKPGTALTALVDHRIATGTFTIRDAEAYRAEALGPVTKPTVKTRYLSGGRTILVSRRPTPEGGWLSIHEDITERRRLQATEREAKETLAAVFDAVPAAIICIAIDRRVMLWSRGAEHIFGYTADETVGQPYKLEPVGAKAESDRLFERILAGETMRDVHVRRRRKDGSLVDISLSCAAMRDRDGAVSGIVYACDDLTERERLAARLEAQNELLKQREEKLKTQNEQLDTALTNMAQGLAMFDGQERLILANSRYGELLGLNPEEMEPGTTLSRIVELRAAKGFYPGKSGSDVLQAMRDRLRGGELTDLIMRPEDRRIVSATVRPRVDGGWIVTLSDISEQERLKKQLQEQNEQLDAALNNMSQGLAMFDGEQRLVVCNKLYGAMYSLTPEQMRPGTTVRQVLEYRFAQGLYKTHDFVETLINRLGQLPADTHRLADGRVIHVTYRRMANGGLVITHEDITTRERLSAQLEEQHRLLKAQEEKLKAQNVQLDVALNNMVQGLAMFDADRRVVIANNRYAELYNLTPDQVKSGTHLRAIIEQRIANGDIRGKSADEIIQAVLRHISPTGESQYTTRTGDGRYIFVSTKPMANGFTVTTHQDITEQRRSEAKIVHMALHDALTGLPNRLLFNERLEHALTRTKRGDIIAAHLLDLDHFKNVNDTLGHPAGDKLLKAVTERLRRAARETDTIARMGGDEFAILQVGIPEIADAGALARRVIDAVREPYEIDGHQVIIGTSVGIAIGPTDGAAPDQLMRNADLALYRAKGDGRGAFSFFEAGMDARMQERRAMEYDLRKALVNGEFELFYQPVVNLQSSHISVFEALLRWRHPEKGLIPPAAFIPLAEEVGFIVPLGEWVIRQACATVARWPSDAKVAVNLSPVQFRSSGLVQTVISALAASGLSPERLELEITEATLLQDGEAALAMLYQLREVGVSIAMDDFGTGYSSLNYLQSFPFDRIKIDRSFIKDITEGAGSLNIVRAVAALARGLGMEATAEGVETELQREKAVSEGCTEMQGLLFSQPRPAHEIEQLYFPDLGKAGSSQAAEDAGRPPIAARAGAR
ncbi:MAG: PAS-domain containing protein [Hyphomonadaceae bacterium]|nr:PAS-domain containing protein [Hyphomonadaceae bacterium]